jgi:hypothetical protein
MHIFSIPWSFFWKSLIVLSNQYFDLTHEASETDLAKISRYLLSDDEIAKVYNILTSFSKIKRDFIRYGFYEKATDVPTSPVAEFNLDRENTETDLRNVSWLTSKLREIHYYQIFDPPIKIGVLSGYVQTRKEKPCSYYPHSNYRKSVHWMLDLKRYKK